MIIIRKKFYRGDRVFMYYKEMLSDDIKKEIKQIMRCKVLTDFEKRVIIKNFCNNLVDSDLIHVYVYIKREVMK